MTRVLIGGPVRSKEGPLWDAYLSCLQAQEGVDVEIKTILDDDSDPSDVKTTHVWRNDSIERVAMIRQEFLDYFTHSQNHYAVMVDDDVMIAKNTVATMIAELEQHRAHVCYGVFWTCWNDYSKPQPQVWDRHPYEVGEELYRACKDGETIEVAGGGALTLFTHEAAHRARYWPRIKSLPKGGMWQGEDRTFALCCEVAQMKQIATAKVKASHLYTPGMRQEGMIQLALNLVGYR